MLRSSATSCLHAEVTYETQGCSRIRMGNVSVDDKECIPALLLLCGRAALAAPAAGSSSGFWKYAQSGCFLAAGFFLSGYECMGPIIQLAPIQSILHDLYGFPDNVCRKHAHPIGNSIQSPRTCATSCNAYSPIVLLRLVSTA